MLIFAIDDEENVLQEIAATIREACETAKMNRETTETAGKAAETAAMSAETESKAGETTHIAAETAGKAAETADKSAETESKAAMITRLTDGGTQIRTFRRGADALEAIRQGERPDVIFSDIEMPGLSGLEFAVRLKVLSPETRIIFATGYEQYAVEAFRIKAHGYLLKPLSAKAVQEELAYMPAGRTAPPDKLVVRCFGHFDVYFRGKPVIFGRKQCKELLAYLIDRRGAACKGQEIALALWEKESTGKAENNRLRVLINALRSTLKEIGMEQALIRERRELAIRTDMVDCDYYRMLEGDMDAVNAYHGEYMQEYSWAEITNARLSFQGK